VEIRFIPLGRIRQQSELRDTKYLSINVFDACLPHLGVILRIVENSKIQTTISWITSPRKRNIIENPHLHLVRDCGYIGIGIVFSGVIHAVKEMINTEVLVHSRTYSNSNQDHESFRYSGDHFIIN